jgi:hypothetical protein
MGVWLTRFLTHKTTDKPDNQNMGGDLSVLSVLSQGDFSKNSQNMNTKVTDKPDNQNMEGGLSVLSVPGSSVQEEFEERLAIAEYDGHQSTAQAERIAYQDAFIAILLSLPEQHSSPKISLNEWLNRRIHSAKAWHSTQDYIFWRNKEPRDHGL